MRSLHWACFAGACVVFLHAPNDTRAKTVLLPIPAIEQATPSGCWAAAAESLSWYAGNPVPQCRIISDTIPSRPECCRVAAMRTSAACDQSLADPGMAPMLARLNITASYRRGKLTPVRIRRELRVGRPIIVGYEYTDRECEEESFLSALNKRPFSCTGHVALLVGYKKTRGAYRYFLINPSDGGRSDVSYRRLARREEHPRHWKSAWTTYIRRPAL